MGPAFHHILGPAPSSIKTLFHAISLKLCYCSCQLYMYDADTAHYVLLAVSELMFRRHSQCSDLLHLPHYHTNPSYHYIHCHVCCRDRIKLSIMSPWQHYSTLSDGHFLCIPFQVVMISAAGRGCSLQTKPDVKACDMTSSQCHCHSILMSGTKFFVH